MRTVWFNGKGGNEVIEIREVDDPVPSVREVLVRVRSSGLNRADLLQRLGLYPPPPGTRAEMPGLELAGVVERVGAGVTEWRPGDRVMTIASGEAQAELALAHERMLVRVPDGISDEAAGGIPEAFATAHDALHAQGHLRPGATILIHAIGSGVATAALQLAHAAGATVIGTSRSDDKLARARELGLDHGILVDRAQPRFADEVKRATGGAGVSLVLDFVGASYLGENLASLSSRGRVVVIGVMGGPSGHIDLGLVLRKRATVVGTVLRSRPLEEKMVVMQELARDLVPLLAGGRVRPVIDEGGALPLGEARAAYERMERNANFGKIVLVP